MLVKDAKGKLKIGDWVRTNGACDGTYDYFEGEIGEITENDFYVWQNKRIGTQGMISPSTKGYANSWHISFDNKTAEVEVIMKENTMLVKDAKGELLIKEKKPTIMENIKTFAKNLSLSADDKLLRKHGLQDECGNYTHDAVELVVNKLAEDNKAYLVEIATKKEEEDKKK